MTKKEFEERFDIVIEGLTKGKCRGCCSALGIGFYEAGKYRDDCREFIMRGEHEKLFGGNGNGLVWYMGPRDREHQEIRINSLLLFKEYCLDSQIYRGL